MNTLPFSYIAVHPGDILKEEIAMRKISQKKLAQVLGLPYTMLNEILNSKRTLSTEVALLFEAAFGISAEMLINIQVRYNLQTALQNKFFKIKLENISALFAN